MQVSVVCLPIPGVAMSRDLLLKCLPASVEHECKVLLFVRIVFFGLLVTLVVKVLGQQQHAAVKHHCLWSSVLRCSSFGDDWFGDGHLAGAPTARLMIGPSVKSSAEVATSAKETARP